MNKKIHLYTKALTVLVVFHILANFLWITINSAPPTWDAALHTIITNKMYTYLQQGLSSFTLVDFLKISDYYPPVIHSFGIILAWIGQGNYKIISLSGTLFFTLALIFQYLYTDKLFKNKYLAFLATFFLSFFITVNQQSRDHMLDIPMTAFLLGGLYFFEKSKALTNKKYSLLFFVFLSLAFLTKWYALVYFAVPLLFSLIQIFKKIDAKKVQNIIFGSVIFLIICAPWYAINWQTVVSIAAETSTGELADPQVLLSGENIFFYLKLILMFQTTFIGFLVFVASLFASAKDIKKKHIALVVSTILFNYIFFSFISNKNIRYIIPLLPFIAMIMANGLTYLQKQQKSIGKVITLALATYFVFTYFMLSFGFPVLPKYKYSVKLPVIGWTDLVYLDSYPVRLLFDRKRTFAIDIAQKIAETKKATAETKIFNLVDRDFLNSYSLDPMFYLGTKINLSNTQLVWLGHLRNYHTATEMTHFIEIEGVTHIVIPEKQIGVIKSIREFEHIQRFQQFILSGSLENFEKTAEYKLPGDAYFTPDTVYVYTKTGP